MHLHCYEVWVRERLKSATFECESRSRVSTNKIATLLCATPLYTFIYILYGPYKIWYIKNLFHHYMIYDFLSLFHNNALSSIYKRVLIDYAVRYYKWYHFIMLEHWNDIFDLSLSDSRTSQTHCLVGPILRSDRLVGPRILNLYF